MQSQPHNLIERAMVHWRIIVTFTAVFVVFGVVSFFTMPRQEFPQFTVRQGLVVGVMPGAPSDEIEEQLTKPVETYLFSFQEVNKKKTYSHSRDGQMVVFVELDEKVKGQDAPAFWAKLRHGLNELKTQRLPSQVVALLGNNDFGDTSALLLTVTAEGRSPRDLDKYVDVLEKHLRRVEATSKLRRMGERQEVIRISIARDKLSRYGVRPATVWASLQGLGGVPAPVRLDGTELELPVYVGKTLRSEKELGDTLVLSEPGGSNVRLKDLANITREYGHDDSYVRYNGKPAMILSVEMQAGHDITRFGKDLDKALDAARAELPKSVEFARIADQPKVVTHSVDHFLRDFGLAIASVIIVTILLLPLRVASVAAVTIPLCILITIGLLNVLGIELETVSLAGLIVVLGMVVDNAIVIIDDHIERIDHGMTPWKAAWKSASSLVVPVSTATLAIIMSYVPMAYFLTGMAGEFVAHLPATIAVALATSLLAAVLLVPVMNSRLIKRGLRTHQTTGKVSSLDRLQGWFDKALERSFRHPWLTLGVGALSIAASGLLGKSVPQQLMPKAERNQFAVEIYLPTGRSLNQTDAVVRRIEDQLKLDKRVVDYTGFVGTSSPRFHTLYAPNMPSRSYAQLVVNTTNDKAVLEIIPEYERRFNGTFPEAWVRWKQLDFQWTKAPIEIRLAGDDIETLKSLAAKIESHAKQIPGATWVRDDFEEPLQAIEVVPDLDAGSRLSVSPAILRTSLAVGLQGLPIATLWEGDYPVKVLLKDDLHSLSSIDGLRQQYVSSMLLGASVPLEQLAKLRPVWKQGVLVHRNGVRTITVLVDVASGRLASPIQAKLDSYVQSLGRQPGISIDYGGEKESFDELMVPFVKALGVGVGLIYLILLCQFKRHRQVLLVMLTMPLSLLGAFLGLKIAHYPFGLTAFVGVIGLMGIVVRNGIILVGYAEELRREHGMSAYDAALAAGKRRMRPIYLTSMAAAIGVVPMILNRSTLWGPLGTVTCFGILVAMVLTLFVVPVAYWLVTRSEVIAPARSNPTTSTAIVTAILLGLGLSLTPASAAAQQNQLSLARAQQLTLANNPSIRQSRTDIEASEETRKSAFTKYFPQVSANAMAMVAREPFFKYSMSGGNLPVYDGNPANLATATQVAYFPGTTMSMGDKALVLALTAIQPLYVGGRISNGNRLAELGVEVAKAKARLAERDELAQTEEKYWTIVMLKEKQKTLEAYLSLLDALEAQVGDAVKSGLTTQNDLLKVSLQRRQTEVTQMRLVQGVELAERDLRRHIGLIEGGTLVLTDPLVAPVDPTSLKNLQHGASDRRIEVHLLERAVQAERLQAALSRGESLPTVSVGASMMHLRVAGLDNMNNAVAFGTVNVPLNGIWEGDHNAKSYDLRAKGAEQKLGAVRDLVDLEAQKDWDDLWVAWRNADVARLAVEQSEVNVREVSDRHANGLVPLSDLLEAQATKQQALDQQIDGRGEYWLRRSAYLRAVGRENNAH